MASAIDATKPAAGSATTQSVRDNFAAAKSEIEALQIDRTPDQGVAAAAGPGTITQIFNWIANRIKAISGETNWYDAVGTSLKSHVANTSNPHGVTAAQIGMAAAVAFTPTIIGTTTAGTGTYTLQTGKYVLSPNNDYYIFSINLVWTAHTGTGNMQIGGMPFASNATVGSSVSIGRADSVSLTAGNIMTAYVLTSSTSIALEQYPTGGGATAAVPIDTAGSVRVSGIIFI